MLIQNYFKVPKDKDMLDIFKPLYLWLTILGLFPYNIKLTKNKKEYVIIKNSIFFNFACAVLFLTVLVVYFVVHVKDLFLPHNMRDAFITKLNYVTELSTFLIFCAVGYFCTFLYRTEHVKILNSITTTFRELPNSDSSIMKQLYFHVNIVTGVVAFVLFLQIAVNFTRTDGLWKTVLVAITFNLAQMLQVSLLGLYYVMILMIAASLLNVRNHVEKLGITNTFISPLSNEYKLPKTTVTLHQIEVTYGRILETKLIINKMFQAPLLVATIQCFHSMVSECHTVYHMVVVTREFSAHLIFNCLIWVVYQVGKIAAMASSGYLLNIRVLQILHTLYNVPTTKQDNRFLLEIEHFASMVTIQKVDITVYELFPIDSTLFYNIMAAASMYIIILVQFDKSK